MSIGCGLMCDGRLMVGGRVMSVMLILMLSPACDRGCTAAWFQTDLHSQQVSITCAMVVWRLWIGICCMLERGSQSLSEACLCMGCCHACVIAATSLLAVCVMVLPSALGCALLRLQTRLQAAYNNMMCR